MAYKVIILYQLYMPSYFLGTFTEYPSLLYRDYFVLGDLQGMVFRHKTLHFTAELIGQENISGNLQQ